MNHVLLDTHLLLWAADGADKLPEDIVQRLNDQNTQPLFSAASIWEVVIKTGLGRKDFNPPYSPVVRSETLSGAVAGVFRDRVHRRRTRLSGEDVRPSETPQMRGLTASQ